MPDLADPITLDVVATAMLDGLRQYLPAHVPDLPQASVSLVSAAERAVGIGGILSGDSAGPLGLVLRRGMRLDAVARFQVWALDPMQADQDIGDLNMRVLADRNNLRANGFLRLALENAGLPETIADPAGPWRGRADYRVLYEYDYEDTNSGQSLISSIPVAIDGEFDETMTISDEMTRWDNKAAGSLVVRGAVSIGNLSMLVFIPKAMPTGTVTLLRTFDGAAGPPTSYATLAQFLAAISAAEPERHARTTFVSFSAFLTAFQDAGEIVTFGDWNGDGVADQYKSLVLPVNPAVTLASVRDRVEVTYNASRLNQVAVVYLRATN